MNMISNQTQKPNIIIVDDNVNFRQGLIFLITIDNIANVIGKAANEKAFIKLLSQLDPHVVLVDISMLLKNEMEFTHLILKMKPDLKIIALTMFGDEEYYFKLNKLGVKGFLLKSGGINELEKAIVSVMKGETYVSGQLLRKIIINYIRSNPAGSNGNAALNTIESKILSFIGEGMSIEAIAQNLSISSLEVKSYKFSILKKISNQNSSQYVLNDSDYILG